MKLKMFRVDAFTDQLFSGNPAAVCMVGTTLPDKLMQNIAAENNLAETAFVLWQSESLQIRWFTPTVEVDLCGHATLASAHILFNDYNFSGEISFFSVKSGILTVKKYDDYLLLNFPADEFMQVETPPEIIAGIGIEPIKTLKGKTDYLSILRTEEEVAGIQPDLKEISKLPGRGLIVSAKGNEADFVSRFFAPQSGIDEDPATGSAHTTLTKYWSKILNKDDLSAIQLSQRKGYLKCRVAGDRIEISGKARTYLKGEIEV